MSGRVAGTFAGMVALLFAASAPVASGATGGAADPSVPAVDAPAATPGASGGVPYSTAPHKRSARPVLTVFSASTSALNSGSPVVRFQVTDRSARVRIRLAFVSLAGGGTYRKNLGWRRTGITHAYDWMPPQNATTGSYRVRITARDPSGYRVVRATTVAVGPPPPTSSGHRFPVLGAHNFGGPDARFGAKRAGHIHQGQDIMAASGTPVVAPHGGQVTWIAYQASGAGYYVVMHEAGQSYWYAFMHLLAGSTAVRVGQSVAKGQLLGKVGATGDAEGPHLHFEIWQGPWQAGGHPIDPLPYLQQWAAGS